METRGSLSVVIGRYDLNSEFYQLQSASLFLESSFGIGPEFSLSGALPDRSAIRTHLGQVAAVSPKQRHHRALRHDDKDAF